ncbi:translation initiation factor IF-2 N-terminal domain-containing protein [Limosilactobacillus fermentum]|nr:translation initiation factor IF-2 N-terminal domain-containing protein [Limosilactobacillus fermentum]
MAKERIYELAKELKMPSKDLVNLAKKEGMDVKTHMSSVTSDEANKLRSMARGRVSQLLLSRHQRSKNTSRPRRRRKPAVRPTKVAKTTRTVTTGEPEQQRQQ